MPGSIELIFIQEKINIFVKVWNSSSTIYLQFRWRNIFYFEISLGIFVFSQIIYEIRTICHTAVVGREIEERNRLICFRYCKVIHIEVKNNQAWITVRKQTMTLNRNLKLKQIIAGEMCSLGSQFNL